jgi:hypothetical protein
MIQLDGTNEKEENLMYNKVDTRDQMKELGFGITPRTCQA